jgi:DNA-binding response OmpR family regulator
MRILIVEDDPEAAAYLVRALGEAGHVADHAADGEDGLAMAEQVAYDVMVVDRMLPKLDGGGLKALKTPKDLEDAIASARGAGKENIVVSVGCGEQERCGDGSYLRPLTIKPE